MKTVFLDSKRLSRRGQDGDFRGLRGSGAVAGAGRAGRAPQGTPAADVSGGARLLRPPGVNRQDAKSAKAQAAAVFAGLSHGRQILPENPGVPGVLAVQRLHRAHPRPPPATTGRSPPSPTFLPSPIVRLGRTINPPASSPSCPSCEISRTYDALGRPAAPDPPGTAPIADRSGCSSSNIFSANRACPARFRWMPSSRST